MADAMLANPDSGFALGKNNVHGAGRSYVLAHHASKLEYLSGDLMLLRKQAWARAGGFPANADVDKARKIFNLRLQNTNHSHLIMETAVAAIPLEQAKIFLCRLFDLRTAKAAWVCLRLLSGNSLGSCFFSVC